MKAFEFSASTDKLAEPVGHGGAEHRTIGEGAHQFIDLDRGIEALHLPKPEGVDPDGPFGHVERAGRDDGRARRGHLFHAGGEMRSLAHCGVIHVKVAADRAHHHLPRVEPHADAHIQSAGPLNLIGPPVHVVLHPKRRIASSHSV